MTDSVIEERGSQTQVTGGVEASEQERGPQAASAAGEGRGRVRREALFSRPWGAAEDLPAEEEVTVTCVDERLVEGAADQLIVIQLSYDGSKNRYGRSSGNRKAMTVLRATLSLTRCGRWFRLRELQSRLLGEHDAANGKDHVSQQV